MAIGDFEKYLAGEPLNEDLAQIRRGEEPITAAAGPIAAPEVSKRIIRLTKSQREALREIRVHPGWGALMAVLEKSSQSLEQHAITMSTHDPLSNQRSIAEMWAYVGLFQKVNRGIEISVDAELDNTKQRGTKQ